MKTVKNTDSYCTPKWLADRLPVVNLDPCSNPRANIRSHVSCSLEDGQNGLKPHWCGSVFLNFPYSNPSPWIAKLHEEIRAGYCTEAIVLPKHDHSTQWWQDLIGHTHMHMATDLWLLNDRLNFDIPPDVLAEMQARHEAKGKRGKCPTSNNFCSSIVHLRPMGAPDLKLDDVATLWRQA